MAPVAGSESVAASVRMVKNTFLECADNSHVMHHGSTQHLVGHWDWDTDSDCDTDSDFLEESDKNPNSDKLLRDVCAGDIDTASSSDQNDDMPLPTADESCPSLSMVLAKLRQKDPRRVLTLRRVDRLPAERAASLLHAHFMSLGPVDAIHIAHSETKTHIHGAARLQPSGVALLVFRNVVDVEIALQLGSTQLVGGVEIEIGRYKAIDVERFEEFVSGKIASQGESLIAMSQC